VVVEKTGLYSFFIMFTIGITKGRWNSMLTALQQFKDDYAKNQSMWRILPEFCQKYPKYETWAWPTCASMSTSSMPSTTLRA
jgi:lysine decarboxylase/arginine decarboxylase